MKRILFICKDRDISYFGGLGNIDSSGLWNSSKAIVKMLNRYGLADAKIVKVIDNNCIDREVTKFRATHVIIEALWVVPAKFEVLRKLHPHVKWFVRLHSDIPFLANEGVAIDWLYKYLKQDNVYIAFNSEDTLEETKKIIHSNKLLYLPNYYEAGDPHARGRFIDRGYVNIGCFGAIRPFKNQLLQAMSAIQFVEHHTDRGLRFFVNSTRVETKGESILKNIRALFINSGHELVEINWLEHDEFVKFMKQKIDIGMQVSFSETFNVVIADMVNCGIPVVVSPEIYWVHPKYQANPNSGKDMIAKLHRAYDAVVTKHHMVNVGLLQDVNKESMRIWKKFLGIRLYKKWWEMWK